MFDTINDATGFANGDKFTSAAQVRKYFTVKNIQGMFGGECGTSAATLRAWAALVIKNRWHCAF